ncbi:MAG: MotA/TolQ/ExbB proton channel family protein [Clostridiales Family XIII bacterium]|jgi:biopolymer transport protein ExbB/TolQ|nr:MotA/TolQ/ExbB proton channel family protein [Clostridiales Family XIII bacterium]
MDISSVKSAIHTVSTVLEIPAIIVLIVAVIIVVAELGSVIIEFFVDRFGRKLNVTKVLEELSGKTGKQMLEIIDANHFQRKQKRAFARLLGNEGLSAEERRLFAVQLLSEEVARQEKTLYITDIIARIAPMFGLMATLIPLGPGLIALGQGDTKALSDSLLTAFDATVSGLAAAGIAFIISKVRKRWYQSDIDAMETIMEEVIL